MKISNLLHFYQPYNQQDDILNRIVNECYRPLVEGLLKRPDSRIVVNITGALTVLLVEKGYADVVEGLKKLAENGQIEFTGSSMYHAFLPLLPEEEIKRQIELNTETNKKYYGESYDPIGFFAPELVIHDKVIKVASNLGYKWMCAAEVAYGPRPAIPNKLFTDKNTGVNIFFRHKRVSTLMLAAMVHTSDDFVYETQDIHERDDYWFTVMDAETFGHHRIGHDKFFFDILDNEFFESVLVKDLLELELPSEEVEVRPSTWTNEEQDFWVDKEKTEESLAKSFILWKDPQNEIHTLQWELVNLALGFVNKHKADNSVEDKKWEKARDQLDKAIASDQFWWASAKPWWSLEMIELGAYELREVFLILDPDGEEAQRAEELYRKIMDKAFEWQRTGYIRKKHLENSATYLKEPFKDRTPSEWFNQVVTEFEDEMKKAADARDFEKAVKWRDALTKIKQGTDIYDVLHVVDELWSARNIPSLEPFLHSDWEDFSDYVKENFIDVFDKEGFEEWKKRDGDKIPRRDGKK